MSIPGSVVPQLVVNSIMVLGIIAYLPRALRRKKNRTFPVTVLVLAAIGLWLNVHGHSISGWQEGFHVDKG